MPANHVALVVRVTPASSKSNALAAPPVRPPNESVSTRTWSLIIASGTSPLLNPDPLLMTCTQTETVCVGLTFPRTRAIFCSICSMASLLGIRVPHRSRCWAVPGCAQMAIASTTASPIRDFMETSSSALEIAGRIAYTLPSVASPSIARAASHARTSRATRG